MERVCKYCGLSESEHHAFVPSMPPGCVCDVGDWLEKPRPICPKYVEERGLGRCIDCEHEKKCHGEAI